MVMDLSDQLVGHVEKEVESEENYLLEKLQIWHFTQLRQALEMNDISLAVEEKYMLIELPNDSVLHFAASTFYEIELLGYVPIIARVEENAYLKRHPKLMQQFVKRGVLMQMSAANIMGENGKTLQKYALKLCKRKLVHIVYLDAKHVKSTPFLLKHTYKYLQKKVSAEYVQYLKGNIKNIHQGNDFHLVK